MGVRLAVLYRFFPKTIDFNKILSAQKYMLGNHMANSASWIHGGNALRTRAEGYGPNRGDRFFVGGGIVNGYVEALPGFPEATDKYALIQTQTSYSVASAAKWVVLANSVEKFSSPDNITCAADFNAKISASVANDSMDRISGNAILAVYGPNNRLATIEVAKFDVQSYGKWSCNFNIGTAEYPLETYTFKVFFWDKNLVPLASVFSKSK